MAKYAVNQRLLFISQKMNKNQNEFADIAGITRQTFQKILQHKNEPGYDTLYSILTNIPFINAQWLMTGDGPMTNIPEEQISLIQEPEFHYKKRCDNCTELESRLKELREDKQLLYETLKNTRAELLDCKNRLEKRKVG